MDLQLNGKKVLVFGSSAGIGKAIAKSLISEKATVCLNSRDDERLQKSVQELKAFDGVKADLTKPNESANAVDAAIKKMNGLDILIMNTGGPKKGAFADITTDQWILDFQNLWLSFVDAVKIALPVMKKQKYGLDHPPRPRLQQRAAVQRQGAHRRHGLERAAAPEAILRCGAQR